MSHYCYVDNCEYAAQDTVTVHAVPWLCFADYKGDDDTGKVLYVSEEDAVITQNITVHPKYVNRSLTADDGVSTDRMCLLTGIHPPIMYDLVHNLKYRVGVTLLQHGTMHAWLAKMKGNTRYEAHSDDQPVVELFGIGDRDELNAEQQLDEMLHGSSPSVSYLLAAQAQALCDDDEEEDSEDECAELHSDDEYTSTHEDDVEDDDDSDDDQNSDSDEEEVECHAKGML